MFASLLTLAALAASAAAQITINTPTGATSAIQCQAYQITWTGGTGPFDVRLLDSQQNTIEDIAPAATTSPVQWTVNQPSGQTFLFTVHDSTGVTGISGQFTIETSSNSACLSASASSGASTAAGSSASSVAPTTTNSAGSTAAVSSVASSSASAAPSSSAAPSAASSASRAGSSAASSASRAGSSAASSASNAASSATSAAAGSSSSSAALKTVAPAGFLGAVVAGLFALAA